VIVIVDYGMGNVGSIQNMLRRIGVESIVSANPAELQAATKLILPGVGAFDAAMQRLHELGLVDVLNAKVKGERVPTLGICLGMQLITCGSDEGSQAGLGWINAWTTRFGLDDDSPLRLPHMGWNSIQLQRSCPLLSGLEQDARFYFVHSYRVAAADEAVVVATTTYGVPFHSVVQSANVMGTQFHPEKSHRFGLRLLDNFARM
jgi:glutamine amidotransferase